MFIKIFTFHNTINIGAILQSRILKDFVEKETFLYTEFDNFQPKKTLHAEYIKPLITKNFYKFKNTIHKNFKIYNWKRKLNKNYSRNLEKKDTKNFVSIYGSDEIWNYKNPFFKLDNYFFGNNNEKIKIAYAISIGNLEFNQNNIPDLVKKNICSFKKIIVRDENTYNFVNLITQKKPFIGCDPSLLDTPDILLGNKSYFSYLSKKNNYLLIYGIFFFKESDY